MDHIKVEARLVPILEDIKLSYGDITKECKFKSGDAKSSLVEKLCARIHLLQTLTPNSIQLEEINRMVDFSSDMKDAGFDVDWFYAHLLRLRDFLKSSSQLTEFETRLQEEKINVDSIRRDMEEKEKFVAKKEEELLRAKAELSGSIRKLEERETRRKEMAQFVELTRKDVGRFHRSSLVYGLFPNRIK